LSTLKQNQKNSSTENIQHPALSKHSEAPIELNKTTKATNNRLTTKIKQAPATKNAHKSESNTNTTLNKSHQTARSAKKPLKIRYVCSALDVGYFQLKSFFDFV
jgi:hypothetical protein